MKQLVVAYIAERCLELGFKVRGIDNFSNGRKENIIELIKNDKFEFLKVIFATIRCVI